jgi:hypothetical protein
VFPARLLISASDFMEMVKTSRATQLKFGMEGDRKYNSNCSQVNAMLRGYGGKS